MADLVRYERLKNALKERASIDEIRLIVGNDSYWTDIKDLVNVGSIISLAIQFDTSVDILKCLVEAGLPLMNIFCE